MTRRSNTTWRTSQRIYTKKPANNCAAARAAWLMIARSTGKEIDSLQLKNGNWMVTFSDGMTGTFCHSQGMTRTSIRQTRAAERLRAAVEIEKAEMESAPGYIIQDGTIELVH